MPRPPIILDPPICDLPGRDATADDAGPWRSVLVGGLVMPGRSDDDLAVERRVRRLAGMVLEEFMQRLAALVDGRPDVVWLVRPMWADEDGRHVRPEGMGGRIGFGFFMRACFRAPGRPVTATGWTSRVEWLGEPPAAPPCSCRIAPECDENGRLVCVDRHEGPGVSPDDCECDAGEDCRRDGDCPGCRNCREWDD